MENNFELLAPAGDMEKLKTALHFGADAVYFAGCKFGLRAYATNFADINEPINYAHKMGKKAYVTVNIYPRNNDLAELETYFKELENAGADGVIVSDIGLMDMVRRVAPKLELHVSTQANTTNVGSALTYVNKFGAKRVVLARELPFSDVAEITKELKKLDAEVEVFVHGAMCISYSGRCLLSNYLTGRDSNRGECVQACRYSYNLVERAEAPENCKFAEERKGNEYEMQEDERGTYILNSKDMCLIEHMKEFMEAGVKSFKIEGRMKSPYYLATTINAYRRAIDAVLLGRDDTDLKPENYVSELENCSHRLFTTGFMFNDGKIRQNYQTSHQVQNSTFLGVIKKTENSDKTTTLPAVELQNALQFSTKITVEMRNRFKIGDEISILSTGKAFGKTFKILNITDTNGEVVPDAKRVQQTLILTIKLTSEATDTTPEEIYQSILPGDIIRG